MIKLDSGHARFAAWLGSTATLIFTLYSGQLAFLTSGLNNLLGSTLGTVFPAYPFFALLLVLTAARWREFHEVLQRERGLTTKLLIRLIGATLILIPILLWWNYFGNEIGINMSYFAMEIAAASFVALAYGVLIAINPSMWRLMLPYAMLYAVGLISPLFLLNLLGGSLAVTSSFLASIMTKILALNVAWHGVSFNFLSSTGESIGSVVTPVCSAAYSISIYLGLLGLMYLDLKGSPLMTAKFAVIGIATIPVLNSARIAATIWFGFQYGSTVFWAVHYWLGYLIFFVFYVAILLVYSASIQKRPSILART